MKLSRMLLGALGAATLATSGGCLIFFDTTGDVEFSYVLLLPDANGQIIAATDCEQVGVDSVRFMVGDDFDNDGILDDDEIQDESLSFCNQLDFDGDGFLNGDAGEFGLFEGTIFGGFYGLFAVEFHDSFGDAIPWETFDVNTNFTRFSFGGGININSNAINIIPFEGDAAQTNAEELQAFFGF